MSSINEKLGLKPATRARPIMKGTGKDEAARVRTSRTCPKCPHRWIVENEQGDRFLCAWCGHLWGAGA